MLISIRLETESMLLGLASVVSGSEAEPPWSWHMLCIRRFVEALGMASGLPLQFHLCGQGICKTDHTEFATCTCTLAFDYTDRPPRDGSRPIDTLGARPLLALPWLWPWWCYPTLLPHRFKQVCTELMVQVEGNVFEERLRSCSCPSESHCHFRWLLAWLGIVVQELQEYPSTRL